MEGGGREGEAHDAGVDALECSGGCLAFALAALETILEVEERLAHGVGVGNSPVVDEGDVLDAPAQEGACDVAAQRSRAHEEALRLRNALQLQRRHQTPLPPSALPSPNPIHILFLSLSLSLLFSRFLSKREQHSHVNSRLFFFL